MHNSRIASHHITSHSVKSPLNSPDTSLDRQTASGVRCLFVVSVELSWLHHDEREQGCDSSRATPDRVIFEAVFAAALVSLNGVWVPVALRVVEIVRD